MSALCNLSKNWGPLAGRILLAFLFLQSGFDKLLKYDITQALMAARGVPEPQIMLPLALAALFAGGVMLLIGWKASWGALALIVFMIPVTWYFHRYWTFPEALQVDQFHHFVKNLGIIGALLLVLGMGSGAMSVDGGDGC